MKGQEADHPMTMTMRTRCAIEYARKLVANEVPPSNDQNFLAVDLAEALVELHDILHDVAGERAGYSVMVERYSAAFAALQEEILGVFGNAEKIIVSDETPIVERAAARESTS